jgi:arylsulfatase A-like enzyme
MYQPAKSPHPLSTRREFLKAAGVGAGAAGIASGSQASTGGKPPNFVIIFLDDAAWADFRPFGSPRYPTPNVLRLAQQGCAFHNFYVPQGVCSASRAALLSGCYPGRTKVFGAHGPNERGLEPTYATMGEVFRARGYKTASFGKWHIGDQPETRPQARGFDESCGLMYSNDMWEFHPESPEHWGQHPLRFWDNGKVTIERVGHEHQAMLTTWYTEHAVDFIRRSRDEPFFLYVPHSMPHVPLYVSDKHRGRSGAGLFGDVMLEIDWSVGEILKALKQNGVEENTLVIFTSDNGPWTSYGNHSGKTPYREAKGTSFDGGTRSACVMRFPGQIEAGSVSERTFCSIDLLPTMAYLAGAELPTNPVDGHNVWDLITDKPGATNPNVYYPFSTSDCFEGLISGDGRWKLHVPHPYRWLVKSGNDGAAGKYSQREIGLALFDMENDPFEITNVIDENPEAAERMLGLAGEHRRKFYSD